MSSLPRVTRIGIGAALFVTAVLALVLYAYRGGRVGQSDAHKEHAPVVLAAGATAPPPAGSEIAIMATGTPLSAAALAHPPPPPPGYQKYVNSAYDFSLSYPPGMRITAYDEGGGATTLVFEDFATKQGFQIFIVPYTEQKISDTRFVQDVPSGVRTHIEATTLSGVPAVTFTSEDTTLGTTREIWALHDGRLYEITTFEGVGSWFASTIGTFAYAP